MVCSFISKHISQRHENTYTYMGWWLGSHTLYNLTLYTNHWDNITTLATWNRPISFVSGDFGKHCPSSWSWMIWQQPLRCPCATSVNSCGAIDLSRSQKFVTYSTIQFWSPWDSCRWLRNVGVASVWGPNTFWSNQAIFQGRCLEAAVAFQSLVLISFQSS